MPTIPQSPPKRMTRARAKAVEEDRVGTRTTKVTAPLTTTATAQKTKRKLRADENDLTDNAEGNTEKAATKPDFARPTKSQTNRNASNIRSATVPTTASKESVNDKAARPRGRPKKIDANIRSSASNVSDVSGPTTRTRTRAGSVNTTAPAKTTATKKKVTFEEDLADKENVAPSKAGKKAGIKSDIKADSNTRSAEVSIKTTPKTADNPSVGNTNKKPSQKHIEIAQTLPKPLSPKKATQIAKGNVTDPEQPSTEQGSRLSPIKNPPGDNEARVYSSDSSRSLNASANLDMEVEYPTSPVKSFNTSMIGSPAKRPPASPFKNSMKATPIKLGRNLDKLEDSAKPQVFNDSTIGRSPPKKFNLGDSQSRPHMQEGANMKSSLLLSPAKRPHSPLKLSGFASSVSISAVKPDLASSSSAVGIAGSPQRPIQSPTKQVTCSLNAAKTLMSPNKPYVLPISDAALSEDELTDADALCSPTKAIATPKWGGFQAKDKQFIESNSKLGNRSSAYPKSQGAVKDVVFESNEDVDIFRDQDCLINTDVESSTPPGLPADLEANGTEFSSLVPHNAFDDHSEDELQSSESKTKAFALSPTSIKSHGTIDPQTPCTVTTLTGSGPMTVLAEKFGQWAGASPDLEIIEERKVARNVFSPINNIGVVQDESESDSHLEEANVVDVSLADKTSEFDIAMMPVDTEDAFITNAPEESLGEDVFWASQTSGASQEYGDENAVPLDPALFESSNLPTTCTPEKVFSKSPRIVHTVSKVPLKPSDDGSPLIRPKKRSRSMTGSLSPGGELELQALRQVHQPYPTLASHNLFPVDSPPSHHNEESIEEEQNQTPRAVSYPGLSTPSVKSSAWSTVATPTRTPRAGLNTKLLKGAVVYVDVHTSEGADASGIFIELLHQMGARCVKQWSWNPRRSLSPEETVSNTSDFETSRIGITHVVFKDGGKRTMEKVREAHGIVHCVGVGWVLDCERENRWLDEAAYAIDVSIVPRGGHRRRKSMEPKALASRESFGVLSGSGQSNLELSPTKEFLNLSSPSNRDETATLPVQDHRVSFVPTQESEDQNAQITPKKAQTPTAFNTPSYDMPSEFGSPATPYFLHPQSLVQQTCPPKQTQELLFPVTGRIDDQPDSTIRQRLLLARRKSLQFAPKIGSPLAKGNF